MNASVFYFTSLIMEGIGFRNNSVCKCKKTDCIYCHPEKYGITQQMEPKEEKILIEMMVGTARNSLEDLHAGTFPSTKTGDYSDVKVVTPYGEIPWNELSRISDKEIGVVKDDMRKEMILALKTFLTFKKEFVKKIFSKK